MDTDSNAIYFIFNCIRAFYDLLNSYTFWGVSLAMWSVGFIVFGMVISIFWRGARG